MPTLLSDAEGKMVFAVNG